MECLRCGECCRTMCPISERACKYLEEVRPTLYRCGIYYRRFRPSQCASAERVHKADCGAQTICRRWAET